MDKWLGLFTKIFPPMSPIQTWRTVIAMCVIALIVNMAIARSWIPGTDGFAQNSSVAGIKTTMEQNAATYKQSITDVQHTQTVILLRLIVGDIESARVQQCKALKEHNTGAAEGWRVRLYSAMYEYQQASGQTYALRDCNEY